MQTNSQRHMTINQFPTVIQQACVIDMTSSIYDGNYAKWVVRVTISAKSRSTPVKHNFATDTHDDNCDLAVFCVSVLVIPFY